MLMAYGSGRLWRWQASVTRCCVRDARVNWSRVPFKAGLWYLTIIGSTTIIVKFMGETFSSSQCCHFE